MDLRSSQTERTVLIVLFVLMSLTVVYALVAFTVSQRQTAALCGSLDQKVDLLSSRTPILPATPTSTPEQEPTATETPTPEEEPTATDTPTLEPEPTETNTPAPSQEEEIPVSAGIAIDYQISESPGIALYPIEQWTIYRNYYAFLATVPTTGTEIVHLALVKKADTGEWQLYHRLPIAASEEAVTPQRWSQFYLFQGQESGEVRYDDTERAHALDETIRLEVDPNGGTERSLMALEEAGATLSLASQLVLFDPTADEPKYVLVVFDDNAPSGGDRNAAWCLNCVGRTCHWWCQRVRYWGW
jgi:hypothetical protein